MARCVKHFNARGPQWHPTQPLVCRSLQDTTVNRTDAVGLVNESPDLIAGISSVPTLNRTTRLSH